MVLAMCFIRKALDWVFTQNELKLLDDIMPEISLREKDDKKKEEEAVLRQEEECETLLDPKNAAPGQENFAPKASIMNFAINGGTDSFVNEMNISEEIAKNSIWKNIQSGERQNNSDSSLNMNSSSKRKHKKRHKKDGNGFHGTGLAPIPSSPTEKSPGGGGNGKSKKGVAFYIEEEDSDKDEKSRCMHIPEIMVDPPSYSSIDSAISKAKY
ncbi:hypothetical protein DPMN_194632 [Dreissena polymorpha]|uniref:Uncharacterized protein n=2 Tax=Dreissena polymorpha TaxID=45954 RepID=A0A9D4BCM9_DREPO|nr:hypothetical protein DPMN_194632 [Dreissena polymorpha]